MKTKSYRCCVKTVIAAAFVLTATPVFAQSAADSSHTDTLSVLARPAEPVRVDTVLFIPKESDVAAAEVANPVDLEKHLTQPPTLALFKSMLVPGLGQWGNQKYVKAAFFAGLEGWLAIKAIDFGGQARDARVAYDAATDANRFDAFQFYDSKRKSRNKYAWFCGFTVFISMFDAYVDAHLSGSPADRRNDQFTVGVGPSSDGGAKASINYNF